jgi:hypothetical protein
MKWNLKVKWKKMKILSWEWEGKREKRKLRVGNSRKGDLLGGREQDGWILEILKLKVKKDILSVRSAAMAIESIMVISMAMASEVVIIVFLSLAVGWGVERKKMNFFEN